jgi:hypothetical protein
MPDANKSNHEPHEQDEEKPQRSGGLRKERKVKKNFAIFAPSLRSLR